MLNLRCALLSLAILLPVGLLGCSDGGGGADDAADRNAGTAGNDAGLRTPAADKSPELALGPSTDAFLGGGSARPATAPPATGTKSASTKPAQPLKPRTSLEGRWELALHGIGGNIIGLLLDIVPEGSGYKVEPVGDSPLGWALREAEIKDDTVQLSLLDPAGRVIDFQGTFADGTVRGTVDSGSVGLDLGTLRPSARDELGPNDTREQTGDVEKVASLKPDENLLANLLQIADEAGTAPLGFQLYGRSLAVIQMQPVQNVDVSKVFESALKAAAPWGSRATHSTQLDIAFTLALRGETPDEALRLLDLAEEGLGGDASDSVQERMALTRGLILVASEGTRDQGIELLKTTREKNPYNFLATSKLAEVLEEQGQLEDALSMHAELIAVPSIPGDQAKAAELWAKLGRQPEDMEQYINGVYEKLVYQFVDRDEPAAPAGEGQQVVLGELFTGATCGPCVAADVATGALEMVFPEDRFLMLRYHQHIPGPDPMTVSDGQQRRDYYEIQGTPTVYFNGHQIQGIGGGFFNAQGVYASLKRLIAPMLEQTSELAIDLSANANEAGDKIQIRAAVTGADKYPSNYRLRLCLAEESIHYLAPNGIRIHEMVVRLMPGGANGVVADEGTLSFEGDVALEEILADIKEGISTANQRSGGQMAKLPAEVSHLRLVAFVQDDDTLEVLQSASTPVNGLAPTTASK